MADGGVQVDDAVLALAVAPLIPHMVFATKHLFAPSMGARPLEGFPDGKYKALMHLMVRIFESARTGNQLSNMVVKHYLKVAANVNRGAIRGAR